MALEYNHDLKAAEKNIRASIELEKNARADQLPKIGKLTLYYTKIESIARKSKWHKTGLKLRKVTSP